MNKTPTVSEVLADERLLRQIAGAVLNPQRIGHRYAYADECAKCGQKCWSVANKKSLPALLEPCIPDPDTRPMEVVAAELTKKCKPWDLVDSIGRVSGIRRMKKDSYNEFTGRWFSWWIFQATPTQQATCAMVALGLVRVDEGGKG